jgi:hypothetical protein
MGGWAKWLAVLAIGSLAAFLPAAFVRAAGPVLTKGPYLQNPSSTAITVQYEASAPGDGFVRFGAGDVMDQVAPALAHEKVESGGDSKTRKPAKGPAYLYRARLTGLKPGTVYRYQVVLSGDMAAEGLPPPRTFRTFPDAPEPIVFIAYGDSRSNPIRHRALASHFMEHKPAFILHNGDMVGNSSSYDQWGPEFFAPLDDVIDRVPILVARGSHEPDPKPVLRFFDFPDGRLWYSFTCGPVHVVVLDSRQEKIEVLRWLEADLAAATAPWKIAMYHNPSFNLASHKSDSGRTTFLPILEKYGVDVVLAGHSHLYERFKPLYPTAPAPGLVSQVTSSDGAVTVADVPRHPITFITTGGGGARLHGAVQNQVLAKASKLYHYCVFTVDAETLHLQTLGPDEREIDSLTITKKSGLYDPAYLAEALPMQKAVFAQGSIRLASPTLPGIPTGSTIPISLKIKFPTLTEPVFASVGLAESSADDYDMDPVTVLVPPGKEVGLVLKVEPRQRVTLEKDPDDRYVSHLEPPLRFVLRAKAITFEQTLESSDVVLRKPEPDTPEPEPKKPDATKPAAKKPAPKTP